MIKNFAKITQWAGEKLGASHGTLPSDEFKDFQTETKKRHEDFEEMRHTMELTIQHIQKNKIASDNGRKRSPMGAYGESLVAHAGIFPRDSINWNMLTSFGLGERRISEAEDRFADHIKDNYVVILQQSAQSFKEYLTLCRKLESRRLDYDAKYNRLQKAKKESPDSEQSVQSAKVKYEETEVDVVQCMISLQETETEHCDALRSMLEAQLCYHKEATRILENVKKGWDQEPTEPAAAPTSNNPTMDDCVDDIKDDCSGTIDAIKPRQQRALYDHIQDHDDELTFHVNDIITVLHEVDDAWWFGEISDSNNNKSRGIFPVNYTEPYTTRKSSNSNSSSISKEEADIAKLKDDIDQGKIIGPSDDSNKSINKNDDDNNSNNNKQTQGITTTTTTTTTDLSSITSPQASSPLPNQSSSSLVSVQSKATTTTTSTSTSKKRSSAQQPPAPPPHASSTIPKTIQQQQQQQQPLIPTAETAPMKLQSPDSIQNTSPTPTNRK